MGCTKIAPEPRLKEPSLKAEVTHISERIDPNAPLGKKSCKPEILAKLAQLEQEIIARAKAQGVI
jgi:hypothetical protein